MVPFKVKCRVKGTGAGRSTGQDRAGRLVLTASPEYGVTAEHRPTETGVLEDIDVAAVEPPPPAHCPHPQTICPEGLSACFALPRPLVCTSSLAPTACTPCISA